MKYIYIFIIYIFTISCKAQNIVDLTVYQQTENTNNKYFKDLNNNYLNFIGTWEYTNSINTFRLILWKKQKAELKFDDEIHYIDILEGKFQIVENANLPNEQIINDSVKFYSQNGTTSNSILTAFNIDNNLCMGTFTDNCANDGNGVIEGSCGLKKNNPTELRFTLQKIGNLLPGETFTVPTDVILTKVN
jgi:hypothetical protein